MTLNKHGRHFNRHHKGGEGEPAGFTWRRLHHTRLFWVGLFMMLLAVTVYVMSDDLAWQPKIQR